MPIFNTTISGGGTTPTGSISITSNGTYDVTDKATAVVNVPTTAPALYREFQLDSTGKLVSNTTTTHIMDFTGMTDINAYIFSTAYYNNRNISGAVNMNDLTSVSGGFAFLNAFAGCVGLTSANLPVLTTVSGTSACSNMFQDCTGLTSADLSSLNTVNGSNGCRDMFHGCTRLTSANLSALTTISGSFACSNMFQDCTGLTSADLSGLTTVSGLSACQYMFSGCTSLATVYIGGTTAINFGTSTNQFNNMFANTTQNIDVYAPAASQAQIEAFSGYPNFGATGTVTWHWRS